MSVRAALVIGLTAAGAGCAGPGLKAGFDAPDPGARLHAIEQAAETDDQSQIPNLVAMLGSDDPAARMLSIRVLERMTGQTHGYDYSAPRSERASAIERWRTWLHATGRVESDMPADGDHWLVRSRPQGSMSAALPSSRTSTSAETTFPASNAR
ncbi:MAG: HEAT repeat domain-containing protein [Phycisphaerales bacterium]